ncbi:MULTISPECIES: H-NS histone family protein [unclassified Burkholderia]|uniref:H-NS histone family protein n=1 Tax=unclassified Burkholderia TaxID=2613784 RepID=UPI000A6E9770|nr:MULTISPECIES: H-NS histone family protein [unclassified Burkholderia]
MTLPSGSYLCWDRVACKECAAVDRPMGYNDKLSGDFYHVDRTCGYQWVAITAEEEELAAEERMKDALGTAGSMLGNSNQENAGHAGARKRENMNSKPTGYLALIAQREALDAQINAAREAEREAAIGQIKALMKEFDLSILDLQEKGHKRNSRRMSTVPKYRDPATGKTWSGRGRQPAWLGNDPAAFLIQPDLLAI